MTYVLRGHEWTTSTPSAPCFAIFRGFRTVGRYVEQIDEPVEIVEVVLGQDKQLAVAMTGRARHWPLSRFEGEWSILEWSGR
jgi:hypothetical protein